MTYKSPLKLFWYKKEQNFGDGISRSIVAHVARREVVWAGHQKCEIYALGSLMKMVQNHHKEPREHGRKPFLWGTGAMSALADLGFIKHVRVALLRGPITAALMQRNDRRFGDTGLLIADVLDAAEGDAPVRHDVVGLVPHMHFADDPQFAKLAAENPSIKLIDVRDPDPLSVVREIASCSHIISQSLHGLVTADAYGIPNTWLDPRGIHGGAMLKFYDYAAGIGRALGLPIEPDQIPRVAAHAHTGLLGYESGIEAAKEALYETFPNRLRQRDYQYALSGAHV